MLKKIFFKIFFFLKKFGKQIFLNIYRWWCHFVLPLPVDDGAFFQCESVVFSQFVLFELESVAFRVAVPITVVGSNKTISFDVQYHISQAYRRRN